MSLITTAVLFHAFIVALVVIANPELRDASAESNATSNAADGTNAETVGANNATIMVTEQEEKRKNTADENEGYLFEGDIKTSFETIRQLYDLNETQANDLILKFGNVTDNRFNHVDKRSASSDHDLLWSSRIVPYVYDSSLSTAVRNKIRKAMDEWESSTCLQFINRIDENDYVYFTDAERGCFSNVGRIGGEQNINLGDGCDNHSTILHEIGHALGFWHEQSRPDRNSYVKIYDENIKSGEDDNFMKRKDKEVDYQGVGYDYASIMHYEREAFLKDSCTGKCLTLDQNNPSVYENQGRPELGKQMHLSSSDILQANRLYTCRGHGEQGVLMVYIRNGINLEDTDHNIFTGAPDPYVNITAVSSTGGIFYKKTSHQQGTRSPTWNEWVYFSDNEWQFFRLRVWDNDIDSDDIMSMSQTFPLLNRRQATSQRLCANTSCNSYVRFDYKILTTVCGHLKVKIRYARNLPDTDPIWNDPDPYVKVSAIKPDGNEYTKKTDTKHGTRNPTWNTWLDMQNGGCEWVGFKVQIWDEDIEYDDRLSDQIDINIMSGYHSNIKICASNSCSGYLYIDYDLIPDTKVCNTNPCLNGGTCNDLCNRYTCSCPSSYTGDRCEHRQRRLRFYARYGRNLPDEDGWGAGDSDPYMEFIAYDVFGNSIQRTTSTDQGDDSPTWNENIDMGTRAWKKFKVRVMDNDVFSDDTLSSWHTWNLPSSSSASRSYVRFDTYGNGYVKFDYTFI